MQNHILLSCDQAYYQDWAINCAKSIQHWVPWMQVSINLINTDTSIQKIPGVKYYHTSVDFSGFQSVAAYYQASRFLVASELFRDGDRVMILDCDTVCTKSFTQAEFAEVCDRISVLWHLKSSRWLAGLVTLGPNLDFAKEYRRRLLEKDPSEWQYGHDQDILKQLADRYNFAKEPPGNWISIGKGKGTFLTLKGDQKQSKKYLDPFLKITTSNTGSATTLETNLED